MKKMCKMCNKDFETKIVIEGNRHNLSNRKYCLECSPFKQHNTKQIHLKKTAPNEKKCSKCEKIKTKNEFYIRKTGTLSSYCKVCASEEVLERKKKLKEKAIEYSGGKCIKCGYDKYIGALEFHHRDPLHKDFSISAHANRSWTLIKIELDKCDLLCANCHRELHGKKWK